MLEITYAPGLVCVSVRMCVFAREIEFVCQTTNYCTNVLRADPGKRVN